MNDPETQSQGVSRSYTRGSGSRSPSHDARRGRCSAPSASKKIRDGLGKRRIVGHWTASGVRERTPTSPTSGRPSSSSSRSAKVPSRISVSGFRNSTKGADVVRNPRLFPYAKPPFSHETVRAHGNSDLTIETVSSVHAESTTTTSSRTPPAWASKVDRHGRSQCPLFADTMITARSCMNVVYQRPATVGTSHPARAWVPADACNAVPRGSHNVSAAIATSTPGGRKPVPAPLTIEL